MSSKGLIDNNTEKQKKVVVGVDFGTSGTGFSFMFVADNTATVHNYTDWDDCGDNKYCKNISAILFHKSDETPESWGYTAQREYLTQDDESDSDSDDDDCFVGTPSTSTAPSTSSSRRKALFKFFKNDLKKDIHGHVEQDGLRIPVKEVTVEYLTYVKELIMDKIMQFDPSISSVDDIRWCFSVPVVWEEVHKKEFRKIVARAGFIDDDECPLHDFMLVAEPEAAAVYCIEKDQRKSLQKDKVIMIIDAGGGTVDITVHKLDHQCKLKTVTIPSGNMFGSTALDDEFLAILSESVTKEKFEKFKKENSLMYLELLANWEKAKREVKDLKKPLKLSVPPRLANLAPDSKLIDHDTLKLKLSSENVERIFKKPLEAIVSQVKDQLKEVRRTLRKPVDFIFLVGGFGQSEVLRKRLKEFETDNTRLVMPKFSGEAVVNGATYLGKDPTLIQTRRSQYTYGIEVEQVFNSSVHEESRCVCKGSEFVVPGVFKTYAKKGEEIETNRITSHKFIIPAGQTEADVNIFFSPKERVKYVSEKGVSLLKHLHINVNPQASDQEITVLMKFGEVEVLVEVVQEDGTTESCKWTGSFQSLKL